VFTETPAKELTEAHCYSRRYCSQLLLIDVIFIWFSDKMLFTLATLKIKRMASGAAKTKRFVRARMTLSQSLTAADGASKLDYASVIFVDPEVQIDET